MRSEPRPATFGGRNIGNTVTELIGPSPSRTALLISVTTADVWVSPDPAMTAGDGIRIGSTMDPLQICTCHYGQFIGMRLFAITAAGTARVYVVEGYEEAWLPEHKAKS